MADGTSHRIPLFDPIQQRLQNRLINKGLRNLGALSGKPQIPGLPNISKAPTLPSLQQYQDIVNRASFAPIRKEAISSFEQGIPSLAERFAELGGNQPILAGLVSSQRGNLENQLAALQQQFEFQRAGLGGGLLGQRAQEQLQLYNLMNELPLRRYALGSQTGLQAQQIGQQGLGQLLTGGLQPRYATYFQPPAPSFLSQLGGGIGQGIGYGIPLAAKFGFGL